MIERDFFLWCMQRKKGERKREREEQNLLLSSSLSFYWKRENGGWDVESVFFLSAHLSSLSFSRVFAFFLSFSLSRSLLPFVGYPGHRRSNFFFFFFSSSSAFLRFFLSVYLSLLFLSFPLSPRLFSVYSSYRWHSAGSFILLSFLRTVVLFSFSLPSFFHSFLLSCFVSSLSLLSSRKRQKD